MPTRALVLASLAFAGFTGCFTSPGDGGSSSTGTSATTAAGGTTSTSGTGSTSTSVSTGSSSGSIGSTGSSGSSGSSGASCWSDADCAPVGSVSQYCDIAVSQCPGSDGVTTPAAGVCRRDCVDGSCTCTSDADCPVFGCDTTRGRCNVGGVFCPAIPPCDEGCVTSHLAVEVCEFCLCSTCPTVVDAGDPCGGCGPDSFCCGAQGGVEVYDAGPSYACHTLDVDGGCPPGAVCSESGSGELESCNFYYP